MVDYRINLAKTLTKTPEYRRGLYNGIIFYQALCTAGMVYVAYLAAFNIRAAYDANHQRRQITQTVSSVSKFGKAFLENPDQAKKELELYAENVALLKMAFSQRTHFLPVLGVLFVNFPADVAVESLEVSADKKSMVFGLVGPGQSIKEQQAEWRRNAELNRLVDSIKQVKGEQRVENGQTVNFVKFECVLKR